MLIPTCLTNLWWFLRGWAEKGKQGPLTHRISIGRNEMNWKLQVLLPLCMSDTQQQPTSPHCCRTCLMVENTIPPMLFYPDVYIAWSHQVISSYLHLVRWNSNSSTSRLASPAQALDPWILALPQYSSWKRPGSEYHLRCCSLDTPSVLTSHSEATVNHWGSKHDQPLAF